MPRFSQNFLIDQTVLPTIIEAANLNSKDLVLEIGPGRGVLTKELCQKAQTVIAIEVDKILIPGLDLLAKKCTNLTVYNADFNSFNWQEIIGKRKFKIVANIPYHITGLIIRNIFNPKFNLPTKVVLMVQWEVAVKMTATENNQNMLSNLIRLYGEAKIIKRVSKNCFSPIPKVDSALIVIENIKKPDISQPEKFLKFIKIGFAARRKTLLNNLAAGLDIPKQDIVKTLNQCGIEPNQRAQTLSINDWKKLYYKLN